MELSRRHLALLLPAMAAAQTPTDTQPKQVPSRTLRFEDLPVKTNGPNSSRAMLNGTTHSGFPLEVHQSELAPGQQPHAPHQHGNEEMILVWQGTLEFTVNGTSTRIGPGSAAYAASNDLHGFKNVGDTNARYFVVALGKKEA